MKRSIILAMVLFSPLLICLMDQMSALAVPVTKTVTVTTTVTTTETDVETSTLSWTYSEFSTVPATRTTTITTTATMMLPVWKVTTVTWPITSTKITWFVTTKLTTKTTTKTVTITIFTITMKIPVTSTYTTYAAVWTWRYTTTTSTFKGTTTQLVVVPVVIYGTLTTEYPTETLTTILSTSASTITVAEVETRTFTQTLTVPYVTEEAAARACIIASVAYNSELAPEVQFLRNFRDNVVMSTEGGRGFMTIFNRWYYSFSPHVARLLSENELLKGVVRVSLYPLLGALFAAASVHSVLAFNPELATVTAGLIAAILSGLFYLFPPLALASAITRRHKARKQ